MRCNKKAPARVVGPRNFCQSLTSQISTRRAEGTYAPTHQWPDRAACSAMRATGAGTRDVPTWNGTSNAEVPKCRRLSLVRVVVFGLNPGTERLTGPAR